MKENLKEQIEAYIENYKEENDGKRPSLRNIGEAFGISHEAVRQILDPAIKARQQHGHREYDTEKSKEKVRECIAEFERANGYAPTIRDLCKLLGLNSTSSVHRYVKMLKEDGKAMSEENKERTLRDKEI